MRLPRRRKAVVMNWTLGVALIAAAVGAYATVNSSATSATPTGGRTVTVARGTVLATVSGAGTLSSPSDAGVSFTTGGVLTEVNVKPGDQVKAGQVLAEVDPTAANETLAQDEASLTAAEASLTKAEQGQTSAAASSGAASASGGRAGASAAPVASPTPTVDPAAVAQAEAQVTSARNAVDAAQRAVDGTVLKAPVDGTVASVAGKVGQTVAGSGGSGSGGSGGGSAGGAGSASAGSTSSSATASASVPTGFVVITNPSGMQVTADFSEADALKLRPGQAATVTLNAEPDTVLNATVTSISSLPASSGSASGSGSSAVQYPATLTLANTAANLRTGLSASVQVVTGEASGALYVPTAAVTGTGASRTVTEVEPDGSTQRVNVTVGVEGDTSVQITSGLAAGAKVRVNTVSSTGTGGFPSGAFPGGLGGVAGRGVGGGARTGGTARLGGAGGRG